MSIDCSSTVAGLKIKNRPMKDDVKLVCAFLALNAGVITVVVAGYFKSDMHIGVLVSHLLG